MAELYETIKDKRTFLSASAKLFVAVGLIILVITWINVDPSWGINTKGVNNQEWTLKSNVGCFIGGIVGSLFSLSGFFLLYLTFQSQKEIFLKERFESKFFELIKLHKENVNEFDIGNKIKGRKCFLQMLNEFHYIYKLTEIGANLSETDKNHLGINLISNNEGISDLAFKIFFFGVGFNSEQQLKHFISENQFAFFENFIKQRLVTIQQGYEVFTQKPRNVSYVYNPLLSGEYSDLTFETECYPFDGHSIRLGHYFRTLFQIVKFVDKQDEILPIKEKKFYISTLRSQLSNQEQLLLYYDSLSIFGASWHAEGYFKKYSFLKNIPLAIVKVKPHPHAKIGKYNEDGEYLFEWDKVQDNQQKNLTDVGAI